MEPVLLCVVTVSDRSSEQVERYILTQKDRAQEQEGIGKGHQHRGEGQHEDHIELRS